MDDCLDKRMKSFYNGNMNSLGIFAGNLGEIIVKLMNFYRHRVRTLMSSLHKTTDVTESVTVGFTEKEIKRAVRYFKISGVSEGKILKKIIGDKLNILSNEAFISALYYIIYYREPDPKGFQSHINSLNSGMSRKELINVFMSTEEYKNRKDAVALVDEVISDWHLPVGGHERGLIKIFKKIKSDSIFVDVGAHVGTWALPLSPFFRKVIAFEPNPLAYKSLLKNVKLNKMNNVIVENMALWNNPTGKLKMVLYNAPSHSTLLKKHPLENVTGDKIGETKVKVTSLDYYLRSDKERIGLIKIDVEGGEVKVIEGAINTIEQHRPSLVIEVHTEENRSKIKDLLSSVGLKACEYEWSGQKYLVYLDGKYIDIGEKILSRGETNQVFFII